MRVLDKSVMSLWAKKEEKSGIFFWLPLMVHLKDTMDVSRWLFEHWLSDSQRELCRKGLKGMGNREAVTPDLASDLASFLGGIHDLGKATPAFQTKKGFSNSKTLDDELKEKLERAGLSGISTVNLRYAVCSPHSLAGEYLLKKFGIDDDIGSIIGGHHGKPVDSLRDILNQSEYEANYFQSNDLRSSVRALWLAAQKETFEWALRENGFSDKDDLPKIPEPVQVIYEGLIIMADWIASNSDYFPLINIDREITENPENRLRIGISKWAGDTPLQTDSYPGKDQLFIDRFGFAPREFQKAVYETTESIRKPGIMILEAPMGEGKTEAALAVTELMMTKTGCSGLFFGLPTQATSNGMFSRIEEWLGSLAKYHDAFQSLRLSHGKAALNEDMNRLRKHADQVNTDGSHDENVYINEWFSGRKKAMLDDFVVGTVDGFLFLALKQKHLALRHLGFSKKVVIVDEVHAYDAYMQQYLEEAIRWMGVYGVPVILVSATLPPEKREAFIETYLRGTGMKKSDMRFPEVSANSYPLITYTDGQNVLVKDDFRGGENKEIHIRKLDNDDLLETVSNLLAEGGVVGIVVNTVKRAQEIGKKCKDRFGSNSVEILHSSYIAADRVRKESDLINEIGKNGKRPEMKIVIGTQVIEQSLDIDFDVMVSDLCPVDLLLQRAGRLHRHDIDRPEKLKEPVLYVMGTNQEFKFARGSEMVYGKYFLIHTQHFLPDTIRVPSDIPVLIQEVYGDEDLKLDGSLKEKYEEAKRKQQIEIEKKKSKAQQFKIDHPNPNKTLIGWLREMDISETEETAAAQVRDIQETIEVIAVKKTGNGYGTFKDNVDVLGRISETRISKDLAGQTIRIPGHIIRKQGISHEIKWLEDYNRKSLSEWQKEPWLKGELGIIFDEDGTFDLNGTELKYDNEYGLREVKEVIDEKI